MKTIITLLALILAIALISGYAVDRYIIGQTQIIKADTGRQVAIIQAKSEADTQRAKTEALINLPYKLASVAGLVVVLIVAIVGLTIYFVNRDRPAPVVHQYYVTQNTVELLPPGGQSRREYYRGLSQRQPLRIEAKR